MTYAKVIKDSITLDGDRLTTFEVRFHRFVLAEFNTHRVLSRNSASSRAIPVQKQIDAVTADPAIPLAWPAEKKGMQGGEELESTDRTLARYRWRKALGSALESVHVLREIGLHKSVTNRLLEPFMWHTVIVTGTAWENFFAQRCSPLAQPEIRAVAELMKKEYEASSPTLLDLGEWHLPYVDDETVAEVVDRSGFIGTVDPASDYPWDALCKISAARCARVSYLTHDGKRDLDADMDLYDRLVTANPPHWSPLEHVATPDANNKQWESYEFWSERLNRQVTVRTAHLPVVGNLLGWRSLRTEVEAEKGLTTYV